MADPCYYSSHLDARPYQMAPARNWPEAHLGERVLQHLPSNLDQALPAGQARSRVPYEQKALVHQVGSSHC